MNHIFNFGNLNLLFGILISMTISLWLLRGFGLLTFFPGSVLWLLILLCITTGIVSSLYGRRGRY